MIVSIETPNPADIHSKTSTPKEEMPGEITDLSGKLNLLRIDQEFSAGIGVDPGYVADKIYEYFKDHHNVKRLVDDIVACDDPEGENFSVREEAGMGRFKVVGKEVLLNGMRAFNLAFKKMNIPMPPGVEELYEEAIKEKFKYRKQ